MLATKIAPQSMLVAALTSAAAGIGGGMAGYAGYKQLQDSNSKQDGLLKEKQQYEDAIGRLNQMTQQQQPMLH